MTVLDDLVAINQARATIANARVAVALNDYIISASTHECLGDWKLFDSKGKSLGKAWYRNKDTIIYSDKFSKESDARVWILESLKSLGWGIVTSDEQEV